MSFPLTGYLRANLIHHQPQEEKENVCALMVNVDMELRALQHRGRTAPQPNWERPRLNVVSVQRRITS